MTIATAADLKSSVALWTKRGDLTAVADDLILLAERRIDRDLRTRWQITTATGTVASESITPPTDLLEIKRLALTVSSGKTALAYVAPDKASQYESAGADPGYYTWQGSTLLVPGGNGYAYTLDYYAKLSALSSGSNWLIVANPDVYLWATCIEAANYVKNSGDLQRFSTMYRAAVDDLKRMEYNRDAGLAVRAA